MTLLDEEGQKSLDVGDCPSPVWYVNGVLKNGPGTEELLLTQGCMMIIFFTS